MTTNFLRPPLLYIFNVTKKLAIKRQKVPTCKIFGWLDKVSLDGKVRLSWFYKTNAWLMSKTGAIHAVKVLEK